MILVAALSALAGALAPLAVTERLLAAASRDAAECRYAAQAVVAYAMAELQVRPSWDSALDGTEPDAFADAARVPHLAGGRRLDLDAVGAALPPVEPGEWGPDRPSWTLFAWGPARALAPGVLESRVYVAVWLADDEGDGDGNPWRDTNGTVSLHGQAYGSVGGRGAVVAKVARIRPAPAALQLLDWRRP